MNKFMMKTVLAMIFIAIGIAMSSNGYELYSDAKASSQWPTASGVITKSEVGKKRDITSKRRNKFQYSPNIAYSYEIDGFAYESNRLEFVSTISKNSMDIREIVANYKAGDTVTVYYNPSDPGYAVLLAGTSWKNHMILLIGPGLIAAGIVTFFIKT